MIAIEYRVALKKKPPPKFEEADPILERFENSLLKDETSNGSTNCTRCIRHSSR